MKRDRWEPQTVEGLIEQLTNVASLDEDDHLKWNGDQISESEMFSLKSHTSLRQTLTKPHQSFFVLFSEFFDDVNEVGVDCVDRRQNHSLLQLIHGHLEVVLDISLNKKKKF